MVTQPIRRYTADEYLEMEETAEYRSEYFQGQIFAMAGATREHGIINLNVAALLLAQLRGGECRPFANDMRVKITETGLYTYPDVVVVCGNQEYEGGRGTTLLNPVLIIEVLSVSMEAYERGEKFQHYRQIPTLYEYLLISQNQQRIERYSRNPQGNWALDEVTGETGELALHSVPARLTLEAVYDGVSRNTTEMPHRPTEPA
ncbi:MAG: Uma2 family endonuclease [Armatimonadaceae bacterium]